MQTMAVKNANRCFCRVKRIGYFHIICIDICYSYSLFPYHSSTTPLPLPYNSLLLYLFRAISMILPTYMYLPVFDLISRDLFPNRGTSCAISNILFVIGFRYFERTLSIA